MNVQICIDPVEHGSSTVTKHQFAGKATPFRLTSVFAPPNLISTFILHNTGDGVCTCAHCKKKIIEISTPKRLSVRVVPLQTGEDVQDKKRRNSVLENYAANYRKSKYS